MVNSGIFTGTLRVVVPAQEGMSRARQRMIRDAFNNGQNLAQEIRYGCAIALAVKSAISTGMKVGDVVYLPNVNACPQFGKNAKDLGYLTFGVIAPDGKRWTLHWEGDAIPDAWVEVAVKHDEGRQIGKKVLNLKLADATTYTTNNKRGRGKGRHDVSPKTGEVYSKITQKHNRLCSKDLAERKERTTGEKRPPA